MLRADRTSVYAGFKPAYTVPGNFITHFCGNDHRKQVRRLIEERPDRLEQAIELPFMELRQNPLSGVPLGRVMDADAFTSKVHK